MAVMKFVVLGTLPGANEYIDACRRDKYGAARLKRQVQAAICCAIRAARLKPVGAPVRISYLWVEPDRRRDKDNVAFAKKWFQDSLVNTGILKGDGWKYVAGFNDSFAVDCKNPRVEVEIVEVKNADY